MRFVGIDPSTKTGLVILSGDGVVLTAKEIEEKGTDPARMSKLITAITIDIQENDVVAIEGFGFASQRGFLLGGIGWGIRIELFRRSIPYYEIAPAALKKFTGAKGNVGKEKVAVETYKRWGFESDSNNVTDAYVLARVAMATQGAEKLPKFQEDVLKKVNRIAG